MLDLSFKGGPGCFKGTIDSYFRSYDICLSGTFMTRACEMDDSLDLGFV